MMNVVRVPVSPSELVNVDGSLEKFYDYRHIAYISSTISSKLFFLISIEIRLAMSKTFVSSYSLDVSSWIYIQKLSISYLSLLNRV